MTEDNLKSGHYYRQWSAVIVTRRISQFWPYTETDFPSLQHSHKRYQIFLLLRVQMEFQN
jgi:hypothetical protein